VVTTRGHRFVDHTADIAIEAWASSEEDLLVEAARALVAVLTEQAEVTGADRIELRLDALDPEDRLVRWLNEVLWLAIGKGFLIRDADIELLPNGLRASLVGRADAADQLVTEVKCTTYHGLRLAQEEPGRYVARVVVDV